MKFSDVNYRKEILDQVSSVPLKNTRNRIDNIDNLVESQIGHQITHQVKARIWIIVQRDLKHQALWEFHREIMIPVQCTINRQILDKAKGRP